MNEDPGPVSGVPARSSHSEAQRRADETERRLQLALDAGQLGTWELDPASGRILLDHRSRELLGLAPAEEATYDGIVWELTHPDDRARTHEAAQRAIDPKGEGRFVVEHRFVRPDGAVRWLEVTGCRISRGEAGSPAVVRVIGTIADVTQRRQNEEALRESEQRFRLALAHSRVAVFEQDLDLRYTWIYNPSLGFTLESTLGRCDRDLLGDDAVPLEQFKRGVLATGEPAHEEVRIHHGEQESWWDLLVEPRRNPEGQIIGLRCVSVDVTQAKRAEEALRQVKESLEVAGRAKDRFLAVLSHELRTPLTPILAVCPVLEEDPGLSDRLRGHRARIRRNVELEVRLIDDLLDLSRIVHGKLELQLARVDLHEILRQVTAMIEAEAAARQVKLLQDLQADLALVPADPARLQQILWNLLRNAVKFTPPGGSVQVRTWKEEDRVLVEVRDTGIGIEPDVLPRIFEAFEQGSSEVTRHFGGLGLGLAISKALAERHGGALSAASEGRGKGATFTLELPALEPSGVAGAAATLHNPGASSTTGSRD